MDEDPEALEVPRGAGDEVGEALGRQFVDRVIEQGLGGGLSCKAREGG